jgi:hypothetical protein
VNFVNRRGNSHRAGICRAVGLAVSILAVGGCGAGKPPFLMVQMCVQDMAGLSRLRQELQTIARDEGMRIGDTSAETRASLEDIERAFREETADSSDNSTLNLPAQLINISVYGEDGLALSAGNIGLSDHDIVIGFSEGHSAIASRQFSLRVINRLSRHWRVRAIPSGQGAHPDPDCDASSAG